MNESEFLQQTDAIFACIETAIDDNDLDVDYLISGNVLDLEFSDGAKIIINRHTANQSCGSRPRAAATISPSRTASGSPCATAPNSSPRSAPPLPPPAVKP